jgi:small subunit ribosomal protein S1
MVKRLKKQPDFNDNQAKGGDTNSLDMTELYDNSLRDLREGSIVKGKIIHKGTKEVVVDIGYKSEGIIPIREFLNPAEVNVGDEIEVLLETKEDEEGRVLISKQKADRAQGWERISTRCKEGDIIDGRVIRKVKGGLMVDVGKLEAFLPASLATLRHYGTVNQLIGQELKFKIVKINRPRRNVVVSRKDVLIEERAKEKAKILSTIDKGVMLTGTVKNITDFGAFIDLGENTTGLLHITDMSWGRVSHPSEVVAIGDSIEVMVLDFDENKTKVSLGLKQKTPNPWLDIDTKYPVGSRIKGKIVNIMPYGAFVELEKGVEGLVHISELSWTKRYNHPNELLAIGDIIETVVLNIDKDAQKMSLGIKQLEQDPWQKVEEKYPVGTTLNGKVRNITDYGAFVELEEGIDGLVHVSDISWTKKIEHPKDVLKKGQRVEAIILSVDARSRRISLGLKQLTPDPWPEISQRYTKEKECEGTIRNITNVGIVVELEKDLDGLIRLADVPKDTNVEERFKVGETITVTVAKTEPSQKRVLLALKQ